MFTFLMVLMIIGVFAFSKEKSVDFDNIGCLFMLAMVIDALLIAGYFTNWYGLA